MDADGKALGGVSMSIHGNGTQTIVTEDDGSFLLLDMQSGSKTFLVIRNGAVSTMVIEMKEAVNAAKAALSADGQGPDASLQGQDAFDEADAEQG